MHKHRLSLVENFYPTAGKCLLELYQNGAIGEVEEINRKLEGQYFLSSVVPHYPMTNLDSRTVFIHINPGSKEEKKNLKDEYSCYDSFLESHIGYVVNYAHERFEKRKEKDVFDYKSGLFLSGFANSGIDRPSGDLNHPQTKMTTTVQAVNNKLGLELIPFGSPQFQAENISKRKRFAEVFLPYFSSMMDVVISAPRDYVIFGSRFATKLLSKLNVAYPDMGLIDSSSEEHKFKIDGLKDNCYFKMYVLNWKGRKVKAGVACTFPKQSLANCYPQMIAYGEACHEVYRNW